MAYSLNRLKAKNINVFFDLSGYETRYIETQHKDEMLGRAFQFVMDEHNVGHPKVIEIKKLLLQLLAEVK